MQGASIRCMISAAEETADYPSRSCLGALGEAAPFREAGLFIKTLSDRSRPAGHHQRPATLRSRQTTGLLAIGGKIAIIGSRGGTACRRPRFDLSAVEELPCRR